MGIVSSTSAPKTARKKQRFEHRQNKNAIRLSVMIPHSSMIPCVACKNLLGAVEADVKNAGDTDQMRIKTISADNV